MSAMLLSESVLHAGATMDWHRHVVSSGYAVSEHEERSGHWDVMSVTLRDINDWIVANNDLFKEGKKVGAWLDEGQIWLDPSTVFPNTPQGKHDAIVAGRDHNQKAIASLDAIASGDWDNAFISTGGTGEVMAKSNHPKRPPDAILEPNAKALMAWIEAQRKLSKAGPPCIGCGDRLPPRPASLPPRGEVAKWDPSQMRHPRGNPFGGRWMSVLAPDMGGGGGGPAMTAAKAYKAGWNSSKRSRTGDMEPSEDKFRGKYGDEHRDDWISGWVDWSADHGLGASYSGPLKEVGGKGMRGYTVTGEAYIVESAEEAAENDLTIDEDDIGKAEEFTISKTDSDKQLVFGWAYVSHDHEGNEVVDKSGDYIEDPWELEEAAYRFVMHSRQGGQDHARDGDSPVVKSTMVESMVFTPEKAEAMGIPPGVLPTNAWWCGFKVEDPTLWQGVKDGRYTSFSIHGSGVRHPVES